MLSNKVFQHSSLDVWDRFKLEAIVASQYHEAYNCSECLKVGEDKKVNKKFRTSKGCFTNRPKPMAIMENGTKSYMCLGRMYTQQEIDILSQYRDYKEYGALPKKGHLNDQSSKTISAFIFIKNEIEKNKEILRKRDKH